LSGESLWQREDDDLKASLSVERRVRAVTPISSARQADGPKKSPNRWAFDKLPFPIRLVMALEKRFEKSRRENDEILRASACHDYRRLVLTVVNIMEYCIALVGHVTKTQECKWLQWRR
jgi:hypothetical protein